MALVVQPFSLRGQECRNKSSRPGHSGNVRSRHFTHKRGKPMFHTRHSSSNPLPPHTKKKDVKKMAALAQRKVPLVPQLAGGFNKHSRLLLSTSGDTGHRSRFHRPRFESAHIRLTCGACTQTFHFTHIRTYAPTCLGEGEMCKISRKLRGVAQP